MHRNGGNTKLSQRTFTQVVAFQPVLSFGLDIVVLMLDPVHVVNSGSRRVCVCICFMTGIFPSFLSYGFAVDFLLAIWFMIAQSLDLPAARNQIGARLSSLAALDF